MTQRNRLSPSRCQLGPIGRVTTVAEPPFQVHFEWPKDDDKLAFNGEGEGEQELIFNFLMDWELKERTV